MPAGDDPALGTNAPWPRSIALCKRYDAAAPALKRSLMLACAATVMADDDVTDREAELIRAIGDALDCPVPPFVQSR